METLILIACIAATIYYLYVISGLSDIKFLNQTDKNPFKSSIDLKELPTVIDLFKKYLNSGERK